jgi:hypothetical protein
VILRGWARLLGSICCLLLPLCTLAKEKPPVFQVVSIEFRPGGRLDGGLLQACDVAKIVTDAIQKQKSTKGTSTGIGLRIDSVAKLRGRPPPGASMAGTELGLTLLAVGSKPMDQPFLCRKDSLVGTSNDAHCGRIAKCSRTVAEQLSTWLAAPDS